MRRTPIVLLLSLIWCCRAWGQTYTIQTIAGSGWNLPAASANLSSLEGVATDGAGNVFMALSAYSVVLRIDPSGQISVVAGNGTQGQSGDGGPAALAQLNSPTSLALDAAGNIYINDSGSNLIRKVSNGVIATVAGGGSESPGDNGPATTAKLSLNFGSGPGLAVDSAGILYFADGNRVRKVSNGTITTAAGGGNGFGDNVSAIDVFIDPVGVAVDPSGNLYFAELCAQRIRKVSGGVITTVAGNGTATVLACAKPALGPDRGNATGISLNIPRGVAVDSAGNVYFTEGAITGAAIPSRVRQVTNGTVLTVAGTSAAGPVGAAVADNVPASGAVLALGDGIAVDAGGNLYLADEYWLPNSNGLAASSGLGRLRKVSNGVITTIAGANSDSGPALGAQLNLPAGLAVDNAGNLFVADSSNNLIREVSNGAIATVAGARGPNDAVFDPQGVAVDSAGNLYLANTGSVVELSHGGVSTIAANTGQAGPGLRPAAVALDPAGNVCFADWTGNRIRMVSNGAISTLAGDGTLGFGGDNGPAASAQLSYPSGVALDGAGNLYFADTGNQRVRKISNGVITTVAGNGTAGFSGDNGPATNAQLNLQPVLVPPPPPSAFLGNLPVFNFPQLPTGIAVDAAGSVYIVDSGNHRVRKVSNGAITTIAGNGSPGFSGDGGPATSAQLNNPSGIAIDAAGKVYLSDSSNGRVRVLLPPGCAYSVSPSSIQSPVSGGSFPVTIQTGAGCSWVISGFPAWITLGVPPPLSGTAKVSLALAANTGAARIASLVVAGQSITVTQAAAPGFGPTVSLVANAFGESTTLAPNTWVEIKGPNLAPAGDARIWQESDFVNNQLPIALDGVSVTINGKSAYVYYISPSQINILTPPDLTLGLIQMTVTVEGSTSAVFSAQVQQNSPSLFVFGGGPYVTAVHGGSPTALIGPPSLCPGSSTPAKPGEPIVLYANGFGPTTTPVVGGSRGQSGNLPALPIIKVGGLGATVQFAGLVSPGLYQFNILVPISAPDGDNPITVTYNGASTQAGTLLTIQH